MMIDVFNHILPAEYIATVERLAPQRPLMFDRACQVPAMVDVAARLRVMDEFPGYRQILSLASPTVDALSPGAGALELARVANDTLARLVDRWPDRFPAFVACLPLADPQAACREAQRAVRELGAAGVQVYTSTNGQPLDRPEMLELFGVMAALERPVWLHPIRAMSTPDYATESHSKFDLWWAFGWPHETSLAMGRLVFAGLFDRWPNLAVITHHVGGTIPMFAGRIASGLAALGTRSAPDQQWAVETALAEPPLAAFQRFYADTASFGSRPAIECGRAFFGIDRLLFATDMPFDPEQGRGYIRDTLRALDEMNLTADERTAILTGNIRRLLPELIRRAE